MGEAAREHRALPDEAKLSEAKTKPQIIQIPRVHSFKAQNVSHHHDEMPKVSETTPSQIPTDLSPKAILAENTQTSGHSDYLTRILLQIAQCLPEDRPSYLSFVDLTLSLDATGTLVQAPLVNIDFNTATSEQINEANSIVQAALLCGPYILEEPKEITLALVADFSAIETSSQVKDNTQDTLFTVSALPQ